MSEKAVNAAEELNKVRYGSFSEIFGKMRELSSEYGNLPFQTLLDAFGIVGRRYSDVIDGNPFTQNRRVKSVATRPANYNKDEISRMVSDPEDSEQPLRAVERSLEYSAYPLKHMRMVYQNLLSYHNYVAPELTDKKASERDDFWREWKLLEKLRKKLNPKDTCHMICGQALQEGKVFYYPRVRVDKAHNKVEHAFLQQLPSDYVKIVGFNNVSKYTIAFNLMYFMIPGTDWRQFGDLFRPYIENFFDAVTQRPTGLGSKVVYASIDMDKVRKNADSRVDAYYQNGTWCYWVTLPVDKVFPFEIDDADRNVLPIFTGLFIDFIQLAQMEQLQLELLSNPLISVLHGEIPYWDTKTDNTSDEYKLSNAGRLFFQQLWYEMLLNNSTSGIGIYMAPLNNMKLESLAEAPSAMEIVTTGYQDVMSQAGLTAIIPASDEARAGAVQVSLAIESRLPQTIYRCYERMMNHVIERLNLGYDWRFHMFGDLSTDEKREESLRNEMTLGILPAVIEYDAMKGRSLLDDIAWSDAVDVSGLLQRRKPLITSYSAKNPDSGLPPHGGRPEADNPASTDGNEADVDQGTAAAVR